VPEFIWIVPNPPSKMKKRPQKYKERYVLLEDVNKDISRQYEDAKKMNRDAHGELGVDAGVEEREAEELGEELGEELQECSKCKAEKPLSVFTNVAKTRYLKTCSQCRTRTVVKPRKIA
jgi:hypothetical protein